MTNRTSLDLLSSSNLLVMMLWHSFVDWTFDEMMTMMLDWSRNSSLINVQRRMTMLMYYPMMKNYAIVFELLLVDFETIPKWKKTFIVVVFFWWWSVKHQSDWTWHVEEKVRLQEKKETVHMSTFYFSIFLNSCSKWHFFNWIRRKKKVKEFLSLSLSRQCVKETESCTIKWTVLPSQTAWNSERNLDLLTWILASFNFVVLANSSRK